MDKKKVYTVILLMVILMAGGITYAYYEAMVQGTGNTNAESSAQTATIGEVEFNGEENFDSSTYNEIYPGFIGIQKFTVSPYKDGHGIYEVDLTSNSSASFGNDIKITLYKTSDSTNNYITRTEGTLVQNSYGFYKQDTLNITGNLTKVYEGILSDKSDLPMENVIFDIKNLKFTTPNVTPDDYYTYYVVYEYIVRDYEQDLEQGQSFNSKITVKYTDVETTPIFANNYIMNLANAGDIEGLSYNEEENFYGYSLNSPNNYVYFNNLMPQTTEKYVPYFDNYLANTFVTQEECLDVKENTDWGLVGSSSCILNTSNAYELRITGYSGFDIFDTIEECNEYLSNNEHIVGALCQKKIVPDAWRIMGVRDGKLFLDYPYTNTPLNDDSLKIVAGEDDALALLPEVVIKSGVGTVEDPYILGLVKDADILYAWAGADNLVTDKDYHNSGISDHGVFLKKINKVSQVCILNNSESVCFGGPGTYSVLKNVFSEENCVIVDEGGSTNANNSQYENIIPSLLINTNNSYLPKKLGSVGGGTVSCHSDSYTCTYEFSRGGIIDIKNAFNSLSPVSCETTEGYFCDSQGNCCDSELNCGSLGLVDKG